MKLIQKFNCNSAFLIIRTQKKIKNGSEKKQKQGQEKNRKEKWEMGKNNIKVQKITEKGQWKNAQNEKYPKVKNVMLWVPWHENPKRCRFFFFFCFAPAQSGLFDNHCVHYNTESHWLGDSFNTIWKIKIHRHINICERCQRGCC